MPSKKVLKESLVSVALVVVGLLVYNKFARQINSVLSRVGI